MIKINESNSDKIKKECILRALKQYADGRDVYKDYDVDVLAEYLFTLNNYGERNAEKMSDKFKLSFGMCKSIMAAVKTELNASFSSSKPASKAQNIDNFLKQKWIKK